MTLVELANALDVAPRQIRFLIAEGILPAAQKTGRSADAYDDEHLLRTQRYLALHRMGMKPASIKVLMAFDDAVPILQEQGVELRVAPHVDPKTINMEVLVQKITEALRLYVGKD